MTLFWLWVGAGCAASAAGGFSAVRFVVPKLRRAAEGRRALPAEPHVHARPHGPEKPVGSARAPVTRSRAASPVRKAPRRATPKRAAPAASPARPGTIAAGGLASVVTVQAPDAAKLTLWARQVVAGERKMSMATDGCRVTWNRVCKHGHPTWLVHLGYLPPSDRRRGGG